MGRRAPGDPGLSGQPPDALLRVAERLPRTTHALFPPLHLHCRGRRATRGSVVGRVSAAAFPASIAPTPVVSGACICQSPWRWGIAQPIWWYAWIARLHMVSWSGPGQTLVGSRGTVGTPYV